MADLAQLRHSLDRDLPARHLDRNLLIASWNIRAFGDLTEKWHSEERDSPKRDLHALHCIAQIVARFDVIGLQEVRGNIRSLRRLLKLLGPHWGVMLTDVTKGSEGNDERMAFLFDTRRVKPSGLACELVVPVEEDPKRIKADAFNRQFARTPYAVSFLAGDNTFILVALHVLYGKKPEDRVPELKAIAGWLADWAKEINDWNHNLIALGDFNIDRRGDPLYDAFLSTGLSAPHELNEVPRTIFHDEGESKFYDQIAWFTGEKGTPVISLDYTGRSGGFDFVPPLLHDQTKAELSWRISDHYPLWCEFTLRRSGA
jgi:endonuclease/exonuclease/phosphatase family metal-dependent hydrolase